MKKTIDSYTAITPSKTPWGRTPRHSSPPPGPATDLDALCQRIAGCSVDELVANMKRHNYQPTIRVDLDLEAAWLVGELEARGLGERVHVFFPTTLGNGVVSSVGHPSSALDRALAGRLVVDRIVARDLGAALDAFDDASFSSAVGV